MTLDLSHQTQHEIAVFSPLGLRVVLFHEVVIPAQVLGLLPMRRVLLLVVLLLVIVLQLLVDVLQVVHCTSLGSWPPVTVVGMVATAMELGRDAAVIVLESLVVVLVYQGSRNAAIMKKKFEKVWLLCLCTKAPETQLQL